MYVSIRKILFTILCVILAACNVTRHSGQVSPYEEIIGWMQGYESHSEIQNHKDRIQEILEAIIVSAKENGVDIDLSIAVLSAETHVPPHESMSVRMFRSREQEVQRPIINDVDLSARLLSQSLSNSPTTEAALKLYWCGESQSHCDTWDLFYEHVIKLYQGLKEEAQSDSDGPV